MDEKKLKRLSLSIMISGLLLLYHIVDDTALEDSHYEFLAGEDEDDVILSGKIKRSNSYENMTFIELQPDDAIDVLVFDDVDEDSLKQDRLIRVQGKISDNVEYEKSIIAERITVIG